MNPNDQRKGIPSPFEKYSKTRWLVRGKVIYNCLVNWEELKAYFAVAEQESAQDACYKARTIVEMLSDPINLLYFHFVSPLVAEFDRVNGFLQATDADPEEMHKELYLHSRSLRYRIYDAHGDLLPLDKVDFGGTFELEAESYIIHQPNACLARAKIESVKWRALRALVPSMLACPRARVPKFLACPRAFHVGVPSCPRARIFGVPSCLPCLRARVPKFSVCPRAFYVGVPSCPNFWRALVPSMLACPRAQILGVPSCLRCWRALAPKFSACPRAFDVHVQDTLEGFDP